MEGVPSENSEVLSHMKWEDRLKEARARREEVLRLKRLEKEKQLANSDAENGPPVGKARNTAEEIQRRAEMAQARVEEARRLAEAKAQSTVVELPVKTIDNVEVLDPETEVEPLPVIVAEPVEEKRGRKGLVGMAFGAGITLGIGIMLFQSQLLNRAPTASDPVLSEAAVQEPAPSAPTALPVTTGQTVTALGVTQPPAKQAIFWAENNQKIASNSFAAAPMLPSTAALQTPTLASVRPSQVFAGAGAPPVLVDVATTFSASKFPITPPDAIASPAPFEIGVWPNDFDKRLVFASSPARLADDITLISLTDNGPKLLDLSSAPRQLLADKAPPPNPITPEVPDVPIWVFASGSVGESILDSAKTAVEGLDMTVRAVNRVNYRISRNQVRYYDPASAATAERVAAAIGAVSRDFTAAGANPPKGTLEIYLAGDAIVARAESSVSSPAVSAITPQPSDLDSIKDSVLGKIRAGLSN